jgi:hypothetical protein
LSSELTAGDSNQQGLITRFYGSNENISILASSKSRRNKNEFLKFEITISFS